MKGAARELRKDTAFLQDQRVQKRRKELAERAMNERRILGLLADQQGNLCFARQLYLGVTDFPPSAFTGELNKLARDARKQHAFVQT